MKEEDIFEGLARIYVESKAEERLVRRKAYLASYRPLPPPKNARPTAATGKGGF
jgi:hypothetical protein